MTPNSSELTPEQKLAFRVDSFLKPVDFSFSSPRAETDYKERADRIQRGQSAGHDAGGGGVWKIKIMHLPMINDHQTIIHPLVHPSTA
jgi:hypothetical protein